MQPLIKIDFNEEDHLYTVDGKEQASVTTILKEQGFIDSTWFTDEARDRGSHIHKATQYMDEGILDIRSIVPEYLPYLKAYKQFSRDYKPDWKLIEFKVADLLHGYTGALDRFGFLSITNQWVLADIKTGVKNKTTGLQTAAYEHGLYNMLDLNQFAELTGVFIKDVRELKIKRIGIYLRKDGTYKIEKYTDKQDIKVFRSATACHNWQRSNL